MKKLYEKNELTFAIVWKQISHRDTLHQSTNTHRQAAAKL